MLSIWRIIFYLSNQLPPKHTIGVLDLTARAEMPIPDCRRMALCCLFVSGLPQRLPPGHTVAEVGAQS
jgi:hypothetical protein